MASPTVVNFVKQQGASGTEQASCGSQFQALNFQPRIIGPLAVLAVILQSAPLFLALGTIQGWCALFPRLNPFDAIYNRFIARDDSTRLAPAPGPRRFAMGMATSFMLGIGFALLAGHGTLAIVLQVFLLVALTALLLGRFCLGSYIFHLLRGDRTFANRTLPWVRG